uniref:Uncharacterized protein n=1 Tax=Setaria viridis TaxID=4556 RepID=A0A4U6W8M2_SETVI|nr:hypothetical protein SEVIR_2G271600v2 [Setaria viridis]
MAATPWFGLVPRTRGPVVMLPPASTDLAWPPAAPTGTEFASDALFLAREPSVLTACAEQELALWKEPSRTPLRTCRGLRRWLFLTSSIGRVLHASVSVVDLQLWTPSSAYPIPTKFSLFSNPSPVHRFNKTGCRTGTKLDETVVLGS